MRVDAARSRNESVAIDNHRARPDDEIDAIARIWIAGATNPADAALANTDTRDPHAIDGIKDDDIRDDEVAGVRSCGPSKSDAVAASFRETDSKLVMLVIDPTGDPQPQASVTKGDDITLDRPVRSGVSSHRLA